MSDKISLTDSELRDQVRALPEAELLALAALIADLLSVRGSGAGVTIKPARIKREPKPKNSAPYIETKTVKGHRYNYKRWRENGVLRSEYLGKAED